MLDFTPDETQTMLVEALHRFAEQRLRPIAREADENGKLPEKIIQSGWAFGLLPSVIPTEYGGFEDSYSAVTAALAAEALAWGDLSACIQILTPHPAALPLLFWGTTAQKNERMPAFCTDKLPAFTTALLEPGILFDALNLKTTAVLAGNSYILNGEKMAVVNADHADEILVYAQEDGRGQAFWVPADAAGLTIVKREKLMGLNALPAFRIKLADCHLPKENRLGDQAGIDFNKFLNHSRVTLCAAAVGVARAGYEYARAYAKQRVQFGKPIAHRQSIAFMLAEMAIDIEAARMMVWEAAWILDKGQDASQEAAILKPFVDEMAVRVADQALQVLGGYGYMREYPVEMWLRNARGFAALEGMVF